MVELDAGSYQLGTGRGADIQLRDKGVGFKHATLTVTTDGLSIEDLKSRGGTFIDDQPVDGVVALASGQPFRVGTVDLAVELTSAPSAPAAAAEPEAADEEPPPALDMAEDEAPAAAAAAPAATPASELPDDVDLLKERYRELERCYLEKAQEATALAEALEARGDAGGEDVGGYDAGIGGYSESVSADLEVRILELQQIADEQTATLLEKDEVIRQLESQLGVLRERNQEALAGAKREQDAMAREYMRGHEKAEEWRQEVDEAKAEVARFEQVNAELVLEVEELNEKIEALRYQLDQEASRRGELVRERTVELRKEAERLEASNAELRTLVEAYEEKIDELDERVEEVEGENEAHETLVNDLREELEKTKQERDTMVKTLRKKVQSLESKVERLQGESARARAAAEAGAET